MRVGLSFLLALAVAGCTDANIERAVKERHTVQTDGAPGAIGPYAQGVHVGDMLFTAGQIGIDPTTGELVDGGVEFETRRAMQNLSAILQAAGFDFGDVVQVQVFLANLSDYEAMNSVYGEHFSGEMPPRATVQVAGLPRGAAVEIMMTAVR